MITKNCCRLCGIVLAGILFAATGAQARQAAPSRDIIAVTMYGTPAELEALLAEPKENFAWKGEDGYEADDVYNVALYYALVCGKRKTAEVLLQHGATWKHLGDMPSMDAECKKRLTSSSVRQSIRKTRKEWAEGDVDGDCDRWEHIHEVMTSHENLALLLRYDNTLCSYQTRCGDTLPQLIQDRSDARALQAVYRRFCSRR